MGVYDRQVAAAQRMITKYGQSVTWKSITDTSPADSNKPWQVGTTSATDYTVRIAFFPEDIVYKESQHLIRATNRALEYVEQSTGSVIGYMPAQSFKPTIKDVVLRDSAELRVDTLKEINVNGQSILWVVGFLL